MGKAASVETGSKRMFTVLGIAGSLRRASFNRGLIRTAIEAAPPGVSVQASDLMDLPMFNADVEAQGDPPAVAALKEAIRTGRGC